MTPRFVLLRGLTREARHWGTFTDTLSRAMGAAEVHALDLPGWGRRRDTRPPASIAATARLVIADARPITGRAPVVLVGLSLGGMVALEWARQAPEQLDGLVLVSSSAAGASPPWHRMRPGAFAALLPVLFWRQGERRERRVWELTAAMADREVDALVARWADIGRDAPAGWRWRAIVQLLAAARYRAPRVRPRVPTLVLAGARDRLVDARCAHPLAEQLGATLRVHADAGHDLPLDDPDWVCRQIGNWLVDTQTSQSR